MPAISIIIPVYNVAPHLRECLDSVCVAVEKVKVECVGMQRKHHPFVEVICVDDGSTDGSGEILEAVARHSTPSTCTFKVIHQENAGAWAARNAALKIAQGEWITFVDADDVLNRNWLVTGLRIAEEHDVDLARLGRCYGKEIPVGFADRVGDESCEVFGGAEAVAWMWNVMAAGGFLWRCFIRRDIIGGLEFLPAINCKEDGIWLLALAQRVKRVAEGCFAGYFYRATEGSLMKQNRKVSQCVGYLEAMGALWTQQSEQAARDGYLDVIRRNIRMSADNDVIEWVMKRAKHDDLPEERIREAYAELESAGVFKGTSYVNRRRYWLGFLWWKRTGQVWAMKIPGLLFLWARMVFDRLKS